MDAEIIEPNWEHCEYCNRSYYEYDTGYAEYSCNLWGDEGDSCLGDSLENGCPLAFKYIREN